MHSLTKFLSLFLSLVLTSTIFSTPTPATTLATSEAQQPQVITETCPNASQLTKTDMIWKGPECWQDDTESFVKEVDRFVEAEWSGINQGALFCKYEGKNKSNFYIVLQCRGKLVNRPDGGKWGIIERWHQGSNAAASDMVCKSDNPNDCPFTIDKPRAPQNVYEEIGKIKTSASINHNQLYW